MAYIGNKKVLFSSNVRISDGELKVKTITENGTYTAADEGVDGYSKVMVDITNGGGGEALTNFVELELPDELKNVELINFVLPNKDILLTASGKYLYIYSNQTKTISLLAEVLGSTKFQMVENVCIIDASIKIATSSYSYEYVVLAYDLDTKQTIELSHSTNASTPAQTRNIVKIGQNWLAYGAGIVIYKPVSKELNIIEYTYSYNNVEIVESGCLVYNAASNAGRVIYYDELTETHISAAQNGNIITKIKNEYIITSSSINGRTYTFNTDTKTFTSLKYITDSIRDVQGVGTAVYEVDVGCLIGSSLGSATLLLYKSEDKSVTVLSDTKGRWSNFCSVGNGANPAYVDVLIGSNGSSTGILRYNGDTQTVDTIWSTGNYWSKFTHVDYGRTLIGSSSTSATEEGLLSYDMNTRQVSKVYEEGKSFTFTVRGENCLVTTSSSSSGIQGVLVYSSFSDTVTHAYPTGYWTRIVEVDKGAIISSAASSTLGVLLFTDGDSSFGVNIDWTLTLVHDAGYNWNIVIDIGNDKLISSSNSKVGLLLYNSNNTSVSVLYNKGYRWEGLYEAGNKYIIGSYYGGQTADDGGLLLYDPIQKTATLLTYLASGGAYYNHFVGDGWLFSSAYYDLYYYSIENETISIAYDGSGSWNSYFEIGGRLYIGCYSSGQGLLEYNPETKKARRISNDSAEYDKKLVIPTTTLLYGTTTLYDAEANRLYDLINFGNVIETGYSYGTFGISDIINKRIGYFKYAYPTKSISNNILIGSGGHGGAFIVIADLSRGQ